MSALKNFRFVLNFILIKRKQSGKGDFFRKNLRLQFDRVFDSESNCGILEIAL